MKSNQDLETTPLDDRFFSDLVGTTTDLSGDTADSQHPVVESEEGKEASQQRTQIPLYKRGSVKSLLILGVSSIPIGGLGLMMFGGEGTKTPAVASNSKPAESSTNTAKAEFSPDPRFATVQNKLAMQDQSRAIEDAAKAQEAERVAKAAADAKAAEDAKAVAAKTQPQTAPANTTPAAATADRPAPRTNVEPPPARSFNSTPSTPKAVAVAPAIVPPAAPTAKPNRRVTFKPKPVAAEERPTVVRPQPVAKEQPTVVRSQPVVTDRSATPAPNPIVPTVQPTWQEATDNAVGLFGEKAASKTAQTQSVQPAQSANATQPIQTPQPQTTDRFVQPIISTTPGEATALPNFARTPVPGVQVYQQPLLPSVPQLQTRPTIQPQSSIRNPALNYIASTSNKTYFQFPIQPAIELTPQPPWVPSTSDRPYSQFPIQPAVELTPQSPWIPFTSDKPYDRSSVRPAVELTPQSPLVTSTGYKDNFKDYQTAEIPQPTMAYQAVVIPGQNRTVSLISPMQLIPGEPTQEILLQVEQGFADTNGGVPIPDGTRIIATVTVAGNGLMRIVAATAIINGENVAIDASSLVLSGTDNNPVIAQYRQFDQGEIGRRDLQTFLVGAASGIGKILTQPNTSAQVSTAGTTVLTSTSNPDVLGGALNGGASPILAAWAKRNEAEISRLQSASRLWYLPIGYKMTIVAIKPFVVNKNQ